MACACLRRRVPRLCPFVTVLLALCGGGAGAQAPVTVSADMKRLLDVGAWQLEYQLSFKSSSSGAGQSRTGPISVQTKLTTEATETLALSERSQGASLTMQKVTRAMSNPAAAASMQKVMMDIVMQTDNIATWMLGAGLPDLGDNPTVQQIQAVALARARGAIGTLTVDFASESRGDRLLDETGAPYRQIVRTTTRGSAGVTQGSQQVTLELNGVTKRLLLMVPITLPAVLDAALAEEVVTLTESPPGSKPSEERTTSQRPFDLFPGPITVTDSELKFGDGGLLIDDPVMVQGGKISGQHTVAASYSSNGNPIAGTLLVKYTLTPR